MTHGKPQGLCWSYKDYLRSVWKCNSQRRWSQHLGEREWVSQVLGSLCHLFPLSFQPGHAGWALQELVSIFLPDKVCFSVCTATWTIPGLFVLNTFSFLILLFWIRTDTFLDFLLCFLYVLLLKLYLFFSKNYKEYKRTNVDILIETGFDDIIL